MTQIYDIVVGTADKHPIKPDGKEILVKLYLGDTKTHGILQNATEHTEEEAQAIKRSWDSEINILNSL